MKLGIRKTVLGVLAAVSLGFAAPLAAPASAASCSELASIDGATSYAAYDPRTGGYTIDVKDTLRTSAAGCSTSWKYTLQLVTQDKTVRSATQTAYGTDRSGAVVFPAFRSSVLPRGTQEVAFDHTSYAKNYFGSYVEQSTRRFVVTVPDVSYDSAYSRNAYPVGSCSANTIESGGLDKVAIGYSAWCR